MGAKRRKTGPSTAINLVRAAWERPAGPPALIILVGLAFLYPLWTRPGIIYSKHSDIIAEHAGVKAIGQRSMATEGRLPLWNPSMNCGSPAFAAPESMYAFPLDLAYMVFSLGRATNLVILLNFLLAGVAMYALSRRALDQRLAAVFCGVAYMLSYRYLAMIHAGWLPKMSMYALTPLLFWACDGLLGSAHVRRAVVFALVVALCLMQSDMQQLYYSGIGCALYASVRVRQTRPGLRLRALAYLAAAGILGIMLSGPVLLPRMEFAALSSRAAPTYPFFLARPPTAGDLKTLVDPRDEGGNRDEFWEKNFYFGLWLYPLVLLAVVSRPRRSRLLVVGLLVMVLLCFDTPALRALYEHLPGFGLFRQSSKLLLLAQFVFLVLGGLGLETLLTDTATGRWTRLFIVLAFCTAGVGALAGLTAGAFAPCVAAGMVGAAGLAFLWRHRLGAAGLGLLCLLPILDSGFRVLPRLAVVPLDQAFPRHAFQDPLRQSKTSGRTAAIGRTAVPYGMAGYYDIDLANGFTALNLKHYLEYFAMLQFADPNQFPKGPWVWTDLHGIAKPDMLRALDVEHLVANQEYDFDPIGYEKVASYRDVPVYSLYRGIVRVPIHVWRLRRRLGPAYFATSVRRITDEAASLDTLMSAGSVLDARVFGLDADPSVLTGTGGTATLVRRTCDRYDYQIDSRGNNFVILSQVWYPGWRATLDGKPIGLYRTNHALLGCVVPPGPHRLNLTMTCPRFWQGLGLASVAGLILTICLLPQVAGGLTRWPR
jgi:hypothetical protein